MLLSFLVFKLPIIMFPIQAFLIFSLSMFFLILACIINKIMSFKNLKKGEILKKIIIGKFIPHFLWII